MLEARALACVRGDRKLFSNLSFSLGEGELLHIRGVNGSGKTTLMRMLAGLSRPYEGEILWGGEGVRSLAEEFRRQLLYIGHHAGIKLELTALENLRIASALSGHGLDEEAAFDALALLGLAGREDLPCKVLSQGQQRRVALARLMVTQAKLWILDEPFNALDVKAVDWLESRLAEHVMAGGLVCLTTHMEVRLPPERAKELRLGE